MFFPDISRMVVEEIKGLTQDHQQCSINIQIKVETMPPSPHRVCQESKIVIQGSVKSKTMLSPIS